MIVVLIGMIGSKSWYLNYLGIKCVIEVAYWLLYACKEKDTNVLYVHECTYSSEWTMCCFFKVILFWLRTVIVRKDKSLWWCIHLNIDSWVNAWRWKSYFVRRSNQKSSQALIHIFLYRLFLIQLTFVPNLDGNLTNERADCKALWIKELWFTKLCCYGPYTHCSQTAYSLKFGLFHLQL